MTYAELFNSVSRAVESRKPVCKTKAFFMEEGINGPGFRVAHEAPAAAPSACVVLRAPGLCLVCAFAGAPRCMFDLWMLQTLY